MNLSKGRIGEDISGLLGALMITKIQLAAMSRVDIPEETRQDFYFYVDEFQNFSTDSFANILSEARKYRLNLILANQYVAQLGEVVRDAIFGNAGTIVSFRVGAMDAEFLEKEFEPVFMTNDIVNLPKYHIYLKLMIDGIAGDAFSATTLPPIEINNANSENSEKIIQLSRERYTNKREPVEEKIRRWSGVLTDEERQALYPVKPAMHPKPMPAAPISSKPIQPQEPRPRPVAPGVPETVVSAPVIQAASVVVVSDSLAEPVVETSPAQEALPEEMVAPKPMYTAQCAVCHEDIQVPFQPDGSRPTFCREHLREYQRVTAQARQNTPSEPPRFAAVPAHPLTSSQAFVPQERPMSLYQMQHIAPKKFKSHRPGPELQGIRDLLPPRKEEN
jgi:CxxC-x17-CxxC domain-containing protein